MATIKFILFLTAIIEKVGIHLAYQLYFDDRIKSQVFFSDRLRLQNSYLNYLFSLNNYLW